jgi:hypothetical protein
MVDIVPIHPEALHGVWSEVKAGLQKILEKSPEDWLPEDIYHALRSGQAQLVLVVGEKGMEGFLVLRVLRREFSRAQDMHVWCAYSRGDEDVFEHGLQFIRNAARQAGCKGITFSSRRKGWMKRFPVQEIIYRIDT